MLLMCNNINGSCLPPPATCLPRLTCATYLSTRPPLPLPPTSSPRLAIPTPSRLRSPPRALTAQHALVGRMLARTIIIGGRRGVSWRR